MKVVAFNGSPRKDGNTTILIKRVFSELEKQGIETELVQLADKVIHGCIACDKCYENKDRRCAVKNDAANEYIEKMLGADGIILGSPVYFQDVTSEMIGPHRSHRLCVQGQRQDVQKEGRRFGGCGASIGCDSCA